MTRRRLARRPSAPGALPTLLVIGGMKCGTSALHRYLDAHPEIAMSQPKELCFFYEAPEGAEEVDGWTPGNWQRGLDWYRAHFPAEVPVRGESSPGYTSPDHPEAAERIASLLPDVRLVMLVRDPVERAISQYRHHRREGSERRPPEEALLDPASQYLSRGRYAQRLGPFLDRFPPEQLLVVTSEELDADRRGALRRVYGFAGADEAFWAAELEQRHHVDPAGAPVAGPQLRARLAEVLRPDVDRLRALLDRPLDEWSI